MATNTYVEVPPQSSGEKIDVRQLPDGGGNNVDRQVTVIGDDTTFAARAKVQNAEPGSGDYALTVRTLDQDFGPLVFHLVSAASDNRSVIKNSQGRAFRILAFNNSASYKPVFIKLFDKASAPNPAVDSVIMTIAVQAGTPRSEKLDGKLFSSGIALAIVGGIADNDDTAVGAGDCVVDLFYK